MKTAAKLIAFILLQIRFMDSLDAQLFPIKASDFNRPFGVLIGPWSGNPQLQFNSKKTDGIQSGFAEHLDNAVYLDLYVGFREKWTLGFTYQGLIYKCKNDYVAYHLEYDWKRLSEKKWTYSTDYGIWNSQFFGAKVSRIKNLTASGKLMADVGCSAGALYMSTPEFAFHADPVTSNWWTTDYQTLLSVGSRHGTGPFLGLNADLGANLGKALHLRFGLDARYGVVNFRDIPVIFTDGTDASNPDKIADFKREITFQQQYCAFGFLFLMGFHIL